MTGDPLELMAGAARAAGIEPSRIVLPEDHEVELNGLRFHYLDWGNSHLPHVVLLHGGSLTAHTWDMSALLLRDSYHLVALDQRGHGDTDWTPNVEDDTGALMVADTRAFLAHLGYEHFTLIGMSMGGINSFQDAAANPQHLDALVIVDVAPEQVRQGILEMEQFAQDTETLARFEDFLDRATKFNPDRAVDHLRYSLTHALRETDEGWTWKNDRRKRPKLDEEERKRQADKRTSLLWEAARAIVTPTLLVRGSESRVLSAEHAREVTEAMQRAELVEIEGARHTVQGDKPGEFAHEVDAFLRRTLPAP